MNERRTTRAAVPALALAGVLVLMTLAAGPTSVRAQQGGGVDGPAREVAGKVAAGDMHTCAIIDGGAVRCWGVGSDGQLGFGDASSIGDDELPSQAGPVFLGVGRRAVAIAAGIAHTCVITDDGSVRCWGYGNVGQLGYGNKSSIGDDETPASAGPVDLGAGRTAVAIAAGGDHTCVVLDDGSARCWGNGDFGALGYGNTADVGDDESPASVGPIDLGPGRTARAIATGTNHSCAILDDGTVRCWGYGQSGQLGYANTATIGDDEVPGSVGVVDLGVGRTAAAISVAEFHTCAILDNGAVRCWGSGSTGRLGYGNTTSVGDDESPGAVGPVHLGAGRTAVGLATGSQHSCAVLDDRTVRCWGEGYYGQLGYGNALAIGDDETPASVGPVMLGGDAWAITAGYEHTCAVLQGGVVICWGRGNDGVLGYGNELTVGNGVVPSTAGPIHLGGRVEFSTNGGGGGGTPPEPVPAGATRFVPLTPQRILDTRLGIGAPLAKVPAGGEIVLSVLGRGGVPSSGVSAVVLNMTAAEAGDAGYVTAYPSGVGRPDASNLNLERAGQTIPNLSTVAVGADGNVRLYSYGATHLIADVAGYYIPVTQPQRPGRFLPIVPTRLIDTRTNPIDPLAARSVRELTVVGHGGVPAAGVSAVVLNVTAVDAREIGYLTLYPTGTPQPVASNLNYVAGQTIPNQVIVPVGTDGKVSIYADGATDVIVDLAGGFTDGSAARSITGLFVPTPPTRVLDTRVGAKVAPNGTATVPAASGVGVPAGVFVSAIAMNVTATESTGPGFVTAYPDGAALPLASNLNLERTGQTIANHVTIGVGDGASDTLFTDGGTHLLADVNGYYLQSLIPLQ